MFAIDYFKKLGVTAVELLPVHQYVNDKTLVDKKLENYWGYNTIGYFAPESGYSSSGIDGEQVKEFKEMVKNLHAAGIEVILDVVYNHTAEGQPPRAHPLLPGHRQHRLLPPRRRKTSVITWITPAPATPSTSRTRACSSSSWTACATG